MIQDKTAVAREVRVAVRHSAIYGLGAVAVKAISFLLLPVYTHYLNPLDYGILEILDISMSLLGMVANMGLTAAVLRYYAAAETEDEKRMTISTAFFFVIGTAIVLFLLGIAFRRPASAMLFGPRVPSIYLLISFASFVLGYIANLPRTYLRAIEASGTFVLLDTVSLLVMLVLNVFLIVVLKAGLLGILLSALVVNIAWIGVCGWTFRRVGTRFSGSLLWQMLAFGLPLILSNLALFTLNFSDRFFLKHLQSLEAVGIYAVAYKFGYMMNFLLVQPFNVMWQSRMYSIYSQKDHGKIFGQMFMLFAVVLTYAGLALSVLSPEIVGIMVDRRFSSSRDVIPLIALAYVFCGLGYYAQLGMFLSRRTKTVGVTSAATAVLNLGLNWFLVQQYGMMGAAWATMLSFCTNAAASYWFSQRCLRLPLPLARVTVTIALGVIFYLLARRWRPESIAAAIWLKGALLGIFPVLLWKARVLSQDEIGTLIATKNDVLAWLLRRAGLGSQRAVSI